MSRKSAIRLAACVLPLPALISGMLVAQTPQQGAPAQPPTDTDIYRIIVPVENVSVPVLVFDRNGAIVNGLNPDQFRLLDNNKEQQIKVDFTYVPISMVVAIQANSRVDKILPQVNKIGNLITPLVIGDQGEAAVVAFDSRVRTLQDFTSNPDKISAAVKTIYAGSTSSRLVDAVDQSIQMLRKRPKDRRRILLVIGETRDYGSEGRGRETLINLELSNIQVYWIDMSHLMGTLTAPGPDPRPDNTPPAAHPLPPNVAATPTTVQQAYGTNGGSAQFLPLMLEIFRDVKNIFKTSPATLFTQGTGGDQFSFYKQHGLEEAITQIGAQLHSQYLVSYNPNNKQEGGFHEIKVEIPGHSYQIVTRPGYWLQPK
jgi:VWFA-related protein